MTDSVSHGIDNDKGLWRHLVYRDVAAMYNHIERLYEQDFRLMGPIRRHQDETEALRVIVYSATLTKIEVVNVVRTFGGDTVVEEYSDGSARVVEHD